MLNRAAEMTRPEQGLGKRQGLQTLPFFIHLDLQEDQLYHSLQTCAMKRLRACAGPKMRARQKTILKRNAKNWRKWPLF